MMLLLPLVGMLLFVAFYLVAVFDYPGGSYISPNAVGFSFRNNYLCDLLDTYAVNGEHNPARWYSRIALFVLCSSLILLWYHLPGLFNSKGLGLTVMRFSGMVALAIPFFLRNGNHDTVLRIAGIFGTLALIIAFVQLFWARLYILFSMGVLCLFIFLVNYYIYETGTFIEVLPVIQKITFLGFIGWFVFLNIQIYKQLKSIENEEGLE
ncbi:hypothetical protein [Flagellimonas meridianipacifica]|uniref:DUF998 domain-containing protein n=1 Tax=Flagellimonas meridianipacifica TaxID=1080225 RepID=A0A2T0MAY7_9FLAO|nr:hypothetical protein [Allomuricauda pacifica]PRX54649.1 hypothetical protein CLV81_3051 [Allomuricauda pacifica]